MNGEGGFSISMSRPITIAALLLALAAPAGPASATVEHVIILVIDGLRSDEGFDDPDHQFVGPLLDDLAPQGSLLTYLEIRGQTLTLPAHQVFVTGTYADCGNTWAYEDRLFLAPRVPTVFDAYRRHTGVDLDRLWIVSNTPLVGHDCEHTLMPGFELERSASSIVDFDYVEDDDWVWAQVEQVLHEHEVELMLVNLHEVDRMGHSQDWEGYLDKAYRGAQGAARFWDRIQADPTYQDNTVVIVATDHGRHSEGVENGFIGHGCSCIGCRKAFLLALGPGIRQGFQSDVGVSYLDIAPTVAHLLGFPFPYHRGRVLTEILEDGNAVDPGPGGVHNPAVAAAGDVRVRAFEFQDTALSDVQGAHQVVIELSTDGGTSWTTTPIGAEMAVQRTPLVWTDGSVVLVGWQEYTVGGEDWMLRMLRWGEESTDWEDVFSEPMAGSGTPVASAMLLQEGSDLFLFESNPRTEVLRTWASDDAGYTWSENLMVSSFRRHFPRDTHIVSRDGDWIIAYSAHIAFEANDEDPNENTEIYWQVSDDHGTNWTVEEQLVDDMAPSIQPVMTIDAGGVLHLVWSDMATGSFELIHAESADGGQTFSTPIPLTYDSMGSWEPAIALDGERPYVAWSSFVGPDEARIHVAALEDGALVEERKVSQPGRMARAPTIVPLGDCTSWVTWSENDMGGPWELGSAQVVTAGLPATSAIGSLLPELLSAGSEPEEALLLLELVIGEEDRGVDRIEMELPPPVVPTGDATLEVDGVAALVTATVSGQSLWFELDTPVVSDGAQLSLGFEVEPGVVSSGASELTVALHHGTEPCSVEGEGDLLLGVHGPGDDDTGGDDDDGCDCRTEGGTAIGGGSVLLLIGLAAARRRGR